MTINEWLPNPEGYDAVGEWVELLNDTAQPVALFGWRIENGSGKGFVLPRKTLLAGEYLILSRDETKLPLRNTNEKLFLYDPQGALRSSASFLGSAPEGKSIARTGEHYVVALPSPREANRVIEQAIISEEMFFRGIALRHDPSAISVVLLACAVGVALAAALVFLLKKSHDFQELFFGRY